MSSSETLAKKIENAQHLVQADKIQTWAETLEASGKRGKGLSAQLDVEKDWNGWCSAQEQDIKDTYVIIWGEPTAHIPGGAYLVTRTAFVQYLNWSKERNKWTCKGAVIPNSKLGFLSYVHSEDHSFLTYFSLVLGSGSLVFTVFGGDKSLAILN
jgi:hypothetical protein